MRKIVNKVVTLTAVLIFIASSFKCMIKSQGISLIGQDASKLAIANEDDTFKIFLKEGNVDYIINSNVRNIPFYTPQGSYTIAEVVFNASGQSVDPYCAKCAGKRRNRPGPGVGCPKRCGPTHRSARPHGSTA